MKAIILCAGFGKRMKPYTDTYQKTMIPVHNKPLLEYLIDGVIYAGIKSIVLVVGYKKEQIIDYFGNGSAKGISIEYVEQKELNGTGGAVLLCEPHIEENHFFLTWGDILVPYKVYKEVVDVHKKYKEDFILTTNYMKDLQKGAEIVVKGNYCVKMVEKPTKIEQKGNLNNNGVFLLSSEIFKVLKNTKPSKRGEIEIPDAISFGIKNYNWQVRVVKMKKDDFRGDFGDLEEYERLKSDYSWLKRLNE